MNRKTKIHLALGGVGALAILLAVVIGVRMFAEGNVGKARRIAAQLQADAIANPNSIGTALPVAVPSAPTSTSASLTTRGSTAPRSPSTSSTSPTRRTGAPATLSPTPTTNKVAVATPAKATAPAIVKSPVTMAATPAIAPWRQPTTAEVNEAISAVHSLVPFFTPTPAQIASSGIEVCTDLNQGESYSAVQADALNMIGASSYSWAIPSSATATAIQTLVALYCPANAAKLH